MRRACPRPNCQQTSGAATAILHFLSSSEIPCYCDKGGNYFEITCCLLTIYLPFYKSTNENSVNFLGPHQNIHDSDCQFRADFLDEMQHIAIFFALLQE
jgi:hypothetical protein